MNDTLSSGMPSARSEAIRAMLVEHAVADVDAQCGGMRVRRRMALAWTLAAAVGVTAVGLLVGDPAATPAYASWTAVPQTAPGAQPSDDDIELWSSKCTDLGVGGVGVQGVPSRPKAAARRDVLVDRRGDFTFCVDVAPGGGTRTDPLIAIAGIKAEGGQEKGLSMASTTVYDKPITRPTNGDVLVLGGGQSRPPRDRSDGSRALDAYQVFGMAGADVTGVDMVLANGLRVTATVGFGIWGVWWPLPLGDPYGSRLEVRTDRGIRTVDPATVGLQWMR